MYMVKYKLFVFLLQRVKWRRNHHQVYVRGQVQSPKLLVPLPILPASKKTKTNTDRSTHQTSLTVCFDFIKLNSFILNELWDFFFIIF